MRHVDWRATERFAVHPFMPFSMAVRERKYTRAVQG